MDVVELYLLICLVVLGDTDGTGGGSMFAGSAMSPVEETNMPAVRLWVAASDSSCVLFWATNN